MKSRLKVLIVDDQELVRYGLRRMLEMEEDMEVVGECASAAEAIAKATKLSPDVVLMDVHLPRVDGIEATRSLKKNGLHCDADVIILADRSDYLIEALKAGAAGYLLKDVKREDLVQAIKEAHRNEHPEDQEEAVQLLIPVQAGLAQIMKFASQVEEALEGNILETAGSWETGTAITVLLGITPLADTVEKLRKMPCVEKAEALTSGKDLASGFPRKLWASRTSGVIPGKRIRVALKEAGIAEHGQLVPLRIGQMAGSVHAA